MSSKVGGIGLLALGLFIAVSFVLQMTGAPPRTMNARLDPYGDVSVHLQTQPDPPKTGGIPLILHITDAGGKPIEIDAVNYEYQFQEQAAQSLQGERAGEGAFQAVAALTNVGEWNVRVTLVKGTQQTQVNFTLRVMPNI